MRHRGDDRDGLTEAAPVTNVLGGNGEHDERPAGYIALLAALVQRDLKRLLAYSSVSHAGFMLIAIAADNELGARALTYAARDLLMRPLADAAREGLHGAVAIEAGPPPRVVAHADSLF